METNNTPTTGTPIEVSDKKRKEDANKVLEMCDLVNSVFLDAKSILSLYNYPSNNLASMCEAFNEVNRNLGIAATWITNPAEPDILPEVEARIRCGID
jgi:hypothetical protein